jgi:alkylation response protein AidB-like acyl-CoA dehydrogenase
MDDPMNDVGAEVPMRVVTGADPGTRARDLGPAIAAHGDVIERTQNIPPDLLTAIHTAGLHRLLLPGSVGGEAVEPWVYLRAIEEVSHHDGSVGWNLFVANSAALIAPFIPLEAARAIYGDRAGWIAWGPPNQYRARAVTGGYRVNGQWHFASGCRQATWMGAHCLVEEPDGTLRLNRFGRPTVKTFLFPKANATPIHDWNTLGMRGTASEGYRVEDLFVPELFTGTREDPSLRRDPGKLYAFTMQGLYAVGVSGVAFGIARAMLDHFFALATDKTPRGYVKLADSPVVQAEFAKREASLGAARAYLVEILRDVWDRADDIAPISTADRARVRLGCAHAIHAAIEIADYVYKAAGVSAIFPGTPFERRFRDMHTLSQQIQARDAHFEAVGRIMFHGDPDESFL